MAEMMGKVIADFIKGLYILVIGLALSVVVLIALVIYLLVK